MSKIKALAAGLMQAIDDEMLALDPSDGDGKRCPGHRHEPSWSRADVRGEGAVHAMNDGSPMGRGAVHGRQRRIETAAVSPFDRAHQLAKSRPCVGPAARIAGFAGRLNLPDAERRILLPMGILIQPRLPRVRQQFVQVHQDSRSSCQPASTPFPQILYAKAPFVSVVQDHYHQCMRPRRTGNPQPRLFVATGSARAVEPGPRSTRGPAWSTRLGLRRSGRRFHGSRQFADWGCSCRLAGVFPPAGRH